MAGLLRRLFVCWGLVRVGGRRMGLLLWMWKLVGRGILLMMLVVIVIVCGSEVVVGCEMEWTVMAFERSPVVLMVSLVLDLFACTLAVAPKTVIVASRVCVCKSLDYFFFARCQV